MQDGLETGYEVPAVGARFKVMLERGLGWGGRVGQGYGMSMSIAEWVKIIARQHTTKQWGIYKVRKQQGSLPQNKLFCLHVILLCNQHHMRIKP